MFEDVIQMQLLVKMNLPFCLDAKYKDIPELRQRKDYSTSHCLTHAKKGIDFTFQRLCTDLFSAWAIVGIQGAWILSFGLSPSRDLFSCLEVLQEKGLQSALAKSFSAGSFKCFCFPKVAEGERSVNSLLLKPVEETEQKKRLNQL